MSSPKNALKRKEWIEKLTIAGRNQKHFKHTPEELLKMRNSQLGSKNHNFGKKTPDEVKMKISKSTKGKKFSMETRRKISVAKTKENWMRGRKGKLGSNWKGGLTENGFLIRNCTEYKLWRTAVFERDNYTCIWCGQIGGKLNADHIKPFSLYPELRFAIDNGRTLCVECHKTTDTYRNPNGTNQFNKNI